VTVTLGGAEESMELLRSPWGHVFFTGSPQVGQVVAKACAEHLTPMTLELGGKSPVMVTQNANLTIAARRIIYGKGLNAGQTCVAPDYVLVHSDVKEALIEKLKDQIQIQYGESQIHCGEYGRIVSTRHFDRLIDLLKNCKILAGARHIRDQRFMELTLVDEPDAQARISKEEIFGPLLPIYSYQNFQEAIKLLKSRPKPLAAYIFSENRSEISQFVSEFSFGGGCVNDTIVHPSNSNLKFGGIAASGIGSYNAHQSFRTFSHAKPIVDSLTSVDLSIRYLPAKSWKYKFLRLIK
jgi:aldehyde dehydrogenase (NAD+)